MNSTIEQLLTSYELSQDSWEDYATWRDVCVEAIRNTTPLELDEHLERVAEDAWIANFSKLEANPTTKNADRFPDNALTVLATWSVEYDAYRGKPGLSPVRDDVVAECLKDLGFGERLEHNWRHYRTGKVSLLYALHRPKREPIPMVWEAFAWACEAVLLRRIRAGCNGKFPENAPRELTPSFSDLLILRHLFSSFNVSERGARAVGDADEISFDDVKMHCDTLRTEYSSVFKNRNEGAEAIDAWSTALFGRTACRGLFKKWGQAYLIRLGWALSGSESLLRGGG